MMSLLQVENKGVIATVHSGAQVLFNSHLSGTSGIVLGWYCSQNSTHIKKITIQINF